jgi:hypothetical protein
MILILDLDRTLNILEPSSVRSIRELAPPRLRARNGAALWEWIARHVNEVEYQVHEPALEVVEALSERADVVVVNTGRPEASRASTMRWLKSHFRVDLLLMRADGDFRPTFEVKRDNHNHSILPLRAGRLTFAFDDNPPAIQFYRHAGAIAFAAPQCWETLSAELRRAGARGNIADMLARRARWQASI